MARKLEAMKIQVYGDSQLIANQVNKSYETKDIIIRKYLDKVRALVFEAFEIDRVLWSQNRRADILNKLVFSAHAHLTKNVLVEILPTVA